MLWKPRWLRMAFTVLAGLVLVSVAQAGRPIKDRANLFPYAVENEAAKDLRRLEDEFGLKVVVETAKTGFFTALQANQVKAMAPEARDRYFAELAKKGVVSAGPRSLYIFIWNDPDLGHVEVQAGSKAAALFPPEDCLRLAKIIKENLEEKKGDECLPAILKFIQVNLHEKDSLVEPPAPFPWYPVLGTVLSMLVAWLFFEIIRGVLQTKHESAPLCVASAGSYLTSLFQMITHGDLGKIPLVFQRNRENIPAQEVSRLESFRASEVHSIIPDGEAPHPDDHSDEVASSLYPHETEVPGPSHGEL